jgi:hypothetical protein
MLLVLACGIAFAAYRSFWWPPPDQNERFHLSAYLAVLVTATLGSFFARPGWRRPFQAFALFAWCNLLFVMWGGFVLSSDYDSHRAASSWGRSSRAISSRKKPRSRSRNRAISLGSRPGDVTTTGGV